MGAYVVVRDGEDFQQALARFERLCLRDQGRPWTKRRYGYYEKPSVLRRKRKRVRARTAQAGRWTEGRPAGSFNFHIDLAAQFRQTGPTIAFGR